MKITGDPGSAPPGARGRPPAPPGCCTPPQLPSQPYRPDSLTKAFSKEAGSKHKEILSHLDTYPPEKWGRGEEEDALEPAVLSVKERGRRPRCPQKGRAWYRGTAHYVVAAVVPENAQPTRGHRAKVEGTESEDRFDFKS